MNPTPEESRGSHCLRTGGGAAAALTGFVLLSIYLFSTAIVPIRSDNDCWWHVKTGQYIVEHGLPSHDVLSYTAADHEWHNHEWLAQVLYFFAWKAGDGSGFDGWRGVVVFNGLMLWATYGLVYWLAGRLSRNWWIALLIAVLAVAVGRRMFYPRPPVISNLMLMIEITLLVGIGEGWWRRAWAFALVPFIALWSNLHGGWMAGGVILALWFVDQAISEFRERLPRLPFAMPKEFLPLRWTIPLGMLCLGATLCNPSGWHLYALPGRVMNDPELVSQIGELASPKFFYVIDFEMAIHAAFFMALLLRKFRPRLFEILLYLFFLHQAIQHVRHLFLFSVALVPLYTRLVADTVDAAGDALGDWGAWPQRWLHVPAAAPLVLALGLGAWVLVNPREGGMWTNPFTPASYLGRNMQFAAGAGYIRGSFPAALCDYIELAELEGNMFNENNYAGYLIWRLSPEKHRVFSDSRFDIFGSKFLRKENIIASGGEGMIDGRRVTWRDLLDEYDVQWLITFANSGLSFALSEPGPRGNWELAARFPPAAGNWEVWIRNTAGNREMLARARATAPLAGAEGGVSR